MDQRAGSSKQLRLIHLQYDRWTVQSKDTVLSRIGFSSIK